MVDRPVLLITGTRKGIGRSLAEHYARSDYRVIGCSRGPIDEPPENYRHFQLDVADEQAVVAAFAQIRREYGRLDALINNAGTALMNHAMLTPMSAAESILRTNTLGTFLFCREAAKLMQRAKFGRIVNLTTVAVPFQLEGEALYAASKSAVETLTKILARELAGFGITVNAVGPAPTATDLIRNVPREKIDQLVARQAVHRMGEVRDTVNAIDFFLRPESDFVTGQVLYLGGA